MIKQPLFESVDKIEFTNRKTELIFLHEIARRATKNRSSSYAILARKGMGKTVLLRRFYNDLFCLQRKIVPFYIDCDQFKDTHSTSPTVRHFMHFYLQAVTTQYIAFHLTDNSIICDQPSYHELQRLLENHINDIPAAQHLHRYIRRGMEITDQNYNDYLLNVVKVTRQLLGRDNYAPGILLIDEFQILTDLYDEQTGKRNDITPLFQDTALSRWCPMVVASSAVSLITRITMGGFLGCRFSTYHLMPFDDKHI